MSVETNLLTALIPDSLITSDLETKKMPSYNHSYLAYRIGRAIDLNDNYNIHIELTLDINGKDYVPDVVIYPKQAVDFLHDEIKVKTMPLTAIEILSPQQSLNELTDKGSLYLANGIQSFWLVLPPTKTVIVYQNISQPVSYSTGHIIDHALNLEIPMELIFR